uniref:BTB domain-containing protein n=1 Tax=Chromera velia CCMP2878 TaxID=1169474 RepID=A0A0G4HIS1_9ALVE|eukprot:Cvel_7045.t1-p1 / transcript=Cvel_7045.t1 / gene=Cvel_7045 / organism=Chromera_velia_CCMP2878 / gene_product=hypothetical protein / transcript_product=hypothetical protein / location=Cvel_scaffold359:87429-88759(+) / protein_length=260 / sequence_SO=supercontig / SO=protein_coding / is_pseudo=false
MLASSRFVASLPDVPVLPSDEAINLDGIHITDTQEEDPLSLDDESIELFLGWCHGEYPLDLTLGTKTLLDILTLVDFFDAKELAKQIRDPLKGLFVLNPPLCRERVLAACVNAQKVEGQIPEFTWSEISLIRNQSESARTEHGRTRTLLETLSDSVPENGVNDTTPTNVLVSSIETKIFVSVHAQTSYGSLGARCSLLVRQGMPADDSPQGGGVEVLRSDADFTQTLLRPFLIPQRGVFCVDTATGLVWSGLDKKVRTRK